MKRPYLALTAIVIVIAVALATLGRPRHTEPPRTSTPVVPVTELLITVTGDRVSPAMSSVPKGHLVRLRVEHRGPGTTRLELTGYQDRLLLPALGPDVKWTGEFLADRPGDDFSWLIDGRPAARFAVTGSHLVEGHR